MLLRHNVGFQTYINQRSDVMLMTTIQSLSSTSDTDIITSVCIFSSGYFKVLSYMTDELSKQIWRMQLIFPWKKL
jgi:hypothetical protein